MNITTQTEVTSLTAFVEGRIDTTTAPQLEAALAKETDGVESLVIDLQ